jgi:hypothetical protein
MSCERIFRVPHTEHTSSTPRIHSYCAWDGHKLCTVHRLLQSSFVSYSDTIEIIKNLKPKTTPEDDTINKTILKSVPNKDNFCIHNIFQACINIVWKYGKITTFLKPGKYPQLPENQHPARLIQILDKFLSSWHSIDCSHILKDCNSLRTSSLAEHRFTTHQFIIKGVKLMMPSKLNKQSQTYVCVFQRISVKGLYWNCFQSSESHILDSYPRIIHI